MKARFAADDKAAPEFKAVREFNCPVRADWVPPKPRGRSHCRKAR
ncbi:hypothetical protein [Bradyrhizobium genosp. SA-3]|nr:hypothetical protein [Bradyrhizobium genosp. SA-3]